MDLWFYFMVIIGFSLLYYGYENKKKYELEIKKIELEQKKLDLEMKKLENGITLQKDNKECVKTLIQQ